MINRSRIHFSVNVSDPLLLRTSEVTLHLLTNADVVRQFLPVEITLSGAPGEPATVQIVPR